MNRSILIVICDFLLVSLLAFSSVDINKVADNGTPPVVKTDLAMTNGAPGRDVSSVMRTALQEEQRSRELLMNELSRTKESLSRQESTLSETERRARALQRELAAREQDAARLKSNETTLWSQFAAAQTNIQSLSNQLKQTTTEAVLSKERLAAVEEELRERARQSEALQGRLATLQQSNQLVLNERMRLATQLQVLDVERRHASLQADQMRQQVEVERQEKARLAEGVTTLASKSQELTQEIRENRPLAANNIFFDVLTNRVQVSISGRRGGAFGGETTRRGVSQTVLVTDGSTTFAVCHVDDTPLALADAAPDWRSISGSVAGNAHQVPVRAIGFYSRDPRIVLVPVAEGDTTQLGVKAYKPSPNPFKFQEAVLLGTRESYYGECRFQMDVTSPDYLKLDRSWIRGLFGKFNPSRGDLVFSRTGEFLGIMVNDNYCLLAQNFKLAAAFNLTQDLRPQQPAKTLDMLQAMVKGLPPKLQ